MTYDYLVVGAGLFGAAFARQMTDAGKKVLVIDRRPHVAGNAYTERVEGIDVHRYGAHIFHTSNEEVWAFVNRFATFNGFINSPLANYKGELYHLPFNMNTFREMWGVETAEEAKAIIEKQIAELPKTEPKNLEEQALRLVGRDVFEKLVKGYTEKQWGRPCKDLPASIIKRLPLRFTFDNNYFNDVYQGIPVGGYTEMTEKMLDGIEVLLGVDYKEFVKSHPGIAKRTVYTGAIDEFYSYEFGPLEYRSLRFETKTLNEKSFQPTAVVNYTEAAVPYTRIIEHKKFEFGEGEKTIVSYEYPETWTLGKEAYYPVNNEKNQALFEKYKKKAEKETDVIFGGRLGEYKYYDMDDVLESALRLAERENN